MRYEIILARGAVQDFKALTARERATVRETIENHLRAAPDRTSRSRMKRLRGIRRPQVCLRVGEIRVHYDVAEKSVEILAVIPRTRAADWLEAIAGDEE